MADISNLYPAPPQQNNQSLLSGDPSKVIGIANALQVMGARNAIGQAYQEAIRPDGSIDTPALMRGIQSRPAAGFMAGEAAAGALSRENQQIQNATALFDQRAKQNQFIVDALGTLSAKQSPTMADVDGLTVTLARNTNIPTGILMAWKQQLPRDPAKLREALIQMKNQAIGSAGISTPTQTGILPGGAPVKGTLGEFNYEVGRAADARTNGPPGIVTGLSPAAQAAASISGPAGASAAVELRKAADMAPTAKAMLGNLEEDLNSFTAGPGADWTRVAKAWTNRNIPLPAGMQFDPKSIASQEAFNKQALQLAQQQFQAIGGTGTDAKFSSAFETNPHETLSQLGNKGVIRLLKGNQDAITAKYRAWQQYRHAHGPESNYDDFSEEFNSNFDPRVFQFKYMTQAERNKYVERMDKNDYDKFTQDLHAARKRGWTNAE